MMLSAVSRRRRAHGSQPVLHRRAQRSARFLVELLEDRTLLSPLTWRTGVDLPTPRAGAAAVLANGAVLVIGGGTTIVNRMYAGADAWTAAGPLDGSRSFAGVAPLPAGQFLLFGGGSGAGGALETSGIYDPTNPDLTQDSDANLSTPRA